MQGEQKNAASMEVWQFRLSMFPEKVRWALDYKGIPYILRSVLPGPHAAQLLLRFGQKEMPVMTQGDVTVKGSAAIIDYIEQLAPHKHPFTRTTRYCSNRRLNCNNGLVNAGQACGGPSFTAFLPRQIMRPAFFPPATRHGQSSYTAKLFRLPVPSCKWTCILARAVLRKASSAYRKFWIL